MKIGINFHTCDEYISGVDYYSLGLINGLLSIDKENEYVVYTNSPQLLKQAQDIYNNLTVRGIGNLRTRAKRIVWEHLYLPTMAKRDGLDILHCTHYITPIVKIGIPYVVTVHDTFAMDHPQWCKLSNMLNYRLFMPRTSFNADAIIVLSQQTSKEVLKYKVRSTPIVIYPGIEESFTHEQNTDRCKEVRTKYNLPDRYLLYVGNIEPKKNLLSLLQAYQLLTLKNFDCKLVLVGKRTWRQENVWSYMQENVAKDNITLTGYVDRQHLPSIYQQAEALVFPSLSEGFGFPILEAMRCGTSVVASSVGILKEISLEAYCRINPKNVTDISEKILSVIGSDSQKKNQINFALKESRRFCWQNCARKTLDIYRQLVA